MSFQNPRHYKDKASNMQKLAEVRTLAESNRSEVIGELKHFIKLHEEEDCHLLDLILAGRYVSWTRGSVTRWGSMLI